MIWIVSGPSNAGKSTFIRSPRCSGLTGLPADAPVLFPIGSTRLSEGIDRDCLFHYNILRSADRQRRGLGGGGPGSAGADFTDFGRDPIWQELIALPVAKSAIVLVADAATLAARARQRSTVEDGSIVNGASVAYPKERWLSLYGSMNFLRLYLAWCAELHRHGIGYRLLDARREAFTDVTVSALPALLDLDPT